MAMVKICGLQTVEAVRETAGLAVDHIGFMFARSKRQVTPEQAGELIRQGLPVKGTAGRPEAVGVFVNPSKEELSAVLDKAPLDVIQLHGQEDAAFCCWVKETFPGVCVFKVISVTSTSAGGEQSQDSSPEAILSSYKPYIDGVLLDTFDPVYGGGSGKTFDWDAIPPFLSWCRQAGIPLLVAGGLAPDNVADLIQTYAPDGVDVSSGVETDGIKDLTKIRSFVERVKTIV
ncbi:phosphoribosylanthranilate isomerase [Paenibacillus cremeus]|uniref:N-(5'-phosphoribosyl)anthranilate isomerase n=1 Tax=Paenibacillus cremeus TaxID=2163881 RepID=A0A559KHL7_9BACL|nr:phosphoribosylanthranilate isomerase [Paenibacillus cremeus]TVY11623.1 phosphoribosylanthranilate isomerase [Paenibacillus cremeus]